MINPMYGIYFDIRMVRTIVTIGELKRIDGISIRISLIGIFLFFIYTV